MHDTPAAHEQARHHGAEAFTVGRHVVFNRGRYRPSAVAGRTLLGHELAHVVQQTIGTTGGTAPGPAHERAAQTAGRALSDGTGAGVISAGPPAAIGVQRAPLPDDQIGQLSAADTDQRLADNEFEALGRKLSPTYFAALEHEHELLARHAAALRQVAQAALDSVTAQIVSEATAAEAVVEDLMVGVPLRPSAYALNGVRGVMGRLATDERFIVQLAGPGAPAAITQSLDKIRRLKLLLRPIVKIADDWHEANPMGESLGMMNERGGTAAAGWGEEQWDKGGIHRVSGALGYIGAYGLAFVDVSESALSMGYHESATAVAKAYADGDISWDEGKDILDRAAWRALLTAAITRGIGRATTTLLGGAAAELGLARSALTTRVAVGSLSGALTAGTGLATQTALTSALAPGHSSLLGQAIWAHGVPRGRDWLLAIPIGMVLGAAGGAADFSRERAALVGRQIDIPGGGRAEILSLETNGNLVLRPVGSQLTARVAAPKATIPMVFDEATGSWVSEASPETAGKSLAPTAPARPTPIAPRPSGTADPANLAPRVPDVLRPPPGPVFTPRALAPGPVPAGLLPTPSLVARLDLATIPGITQSEIEMLNRLPQAAWDRVIDYVGPKTGADAIKGKLAEELFPLTSAFNAVRQRAIARAAAAGISADAVQFVQDIRGVTPRQRGGAGTGELGDGMFVARVGSTIRVLAVLESKSPGNLAALASRKGEALGQVGWDFERMRQVPTTIQGTTYAPSQLQVSRTGTEWVGIAPPDFDLTPAQLSAIQQGMPGFHLEHGPISDAALHEVAVRLAAIARAARTP